jgi:hypothetical protein
MVPSLHLALFSTMLNLKYIEVCFISSCKDVNSERHTKSTLMFGFLFKQPYFITQFFSIFLTEGCVSYEAVELPAMVAITEFQIFFVHYQ